MSGKRANGEGSIYPYKGGYAGHVWVTTPDGKRTRSGAETQSHGRPPKLRAFAGSVSVRSVARRPGVRGRPFPHGSCRRFAEGGHIRAASNIACCRGEQPQTAGTRAI